MEKNIPIAEAKNRLPAIIRGLEREPAVTLTRHGKPVAVLLSAEEYRRLSRTGNFADALAKFRRRLVESEVVITDDDLAGLRDHTAGRPVSL